MRKGISIVVSAAGRRRIEATVADKSSARNHVWRVRIVLPSEAGLGTVAIMRVTGKSKPCVWRWRERFIKETNENPKPFVWTKDASKVIAAVKPGHQVLDSIHQASRPPPVPSNPIGIIIKWLANVKMYQHYNVRCQVR